MLNKQDNFKNCKQNLILPSKDVYYFLLESIWKYNQQNPSQKFKRVKRKDKKSMQFDKLCCYQKPSDFFRTLSINDLYDIKIDFDRDKRYPNQLVWIFFIFINNIKVYCKLKFYNKTTKIISFHKSTK